MFAIVWRGFALRHAPTLLEEARRLLEAVADADRLALLLSTPAQISFAVRFVCPARRAERRATGRAELTAATGRACASALRELYTLELPRPAVDSDDDVYSLKDDVREAVFQVLRPLRQTKRLLFEAITVAYLAASKGISPQLTRLVTTL